MNKKSYNFYLSPEANEMIDANLEPAIIRSRSDFVEKAVRYFAASISADVHKEVLAHEIIDAIRFNIKNSENHIAATLFKLAGEQATLNLVIADLIIEGFDETTLKSYRNAAYDMVRKKHGVFTFADAVADAAAVAQSDDDGEFGDVYDD